jgi:hypothetical protein
MPENKHSLPHWSKANGNHADLHDTVSEGLLKVPDKVHYLLDEAPAKPGTLDSLRQRLGVTKGY